MTWRTMHMMPCIHTSDKKKEGVSLQVSPFLCVSSHREKRIMATTLLETLEAMRGTVPRELRRQLERHGIRLSSTFFVRPHKPVCSATCRTGMPCRRACHADKTMCLTHYKQSIRPTKAKCSETTAKGTPCKCTVYKGLQMCYSHAKKAQILPEAPTECPICSCDLTPENTTKTKCGHTFCTECINRWAVSKGTRVKAMTRVSCPMCRTSIRILAGPEWYTYGGLPPTHATSGAEWIQRLDLLPTSPMMTREQFEAQAQIFGRWLLEFMRFGSVDDYEVVTAMHVAGFTRRHSPRG